MKKLALGILVVATSLPVLSENDLSAELLLGSADQKTIFNGSDSISGDDMSIGVRGAYLLNQYVAFELAYINYGEAEDSNIDEFGDTIIDKSSTSAFTLGVKGIIPLENGFSINGRVGVSKWDFEVEETDSSSPGEVFKLDNDGIDLYYGVGVEYSLNKQIAFGLEYTFTEMGLSPLGIKADHEVKNIAVSVGYSF